MRAMRETTRKRSYLPILLLQSPGANHARRGEIIDPGKDERDWEAQQSQSDHPPDGPLFQAKGRDDDVGGLQHRESYGGIQYRDSGHVPTSGFLEDGAKIGQLRFRSLK
jgi:hypothetical protein